MYRNDPESCAQHAKNDHTDSIPFGALHSKLKRWKSAEFFLFKSDKK